MEAPDAPPDLPAKAVLEALLFSSEAPVPLGDLGQALGIPAEQVLALAGELRADYAQSGRAFGIEEIAGGLQLLTLPEFAPWLARLRPPRHQGKLSPAALETLAIIAYKQPVTRAEIESIRGVQAGPVLRALLDRELVRTAGRAEVLGSPLLYTTTERFLELYGMKGLEDLPQSSDFRTAASAGPSETPPSSEPAVPIPALPQGPEAS